MADNEGTGAAQRMAGGRGMPPQLWAAARRFGVLAILGVAALAMVALWVLLVLEDEAVGFGFSWARVPDDVFIGLLVAHLVTAPIAWLTAVMVLMSAGRQTAGTLGVIVVPVAAGVSLLAAMTDAWAWHTAAAQASGLGSYLVAVALVAAGPLSLLALLTVAFREWLRRPLAAA